MANGAYMQEQGIVNIVGAGRVYETWAFIELTMGLTSPHTILVKGTVGMLVVMVVIVIIDCSASHNFISLGL